MKADWVRISMATGEVFCERCKDRYTINLPAPIDVVVATTQAYGKIHKRCRPAKSVAP